MRLDHSTHIVLLRHGQTDYNAERRFQGQADIPLNALGVQQAERAREALSRFEFDAIYSSPLKRALETARLVRPEAEILTDDRLMEINVGTHSGRTWAEVLEEMPDYDYNEAQGIDFRRSETGETMAEVVERGMAAFTEIGERHEDQTVLIVSHGFLLRHVLHELLGIEDKVLGRLGNARYSELGYSHGAWRLLAHNVGALGGH